jgi:hypothetical protein
MKRKVLLAGVLFLPVLFGWGCTEDPFYNSEGNYDNPRDLDYSDVVNAREYAAIRTGKPTVMTGGLVPYFELVSVRDADGNTLSGEYLSKVSVIQPITSEIPLEEEKWYVLNGDSVKTYFGTDSRDAGVIVIEDENPYGIGDYYFTLKVTVKPPEGDSLSTTFKDAFHLQVGPELVSNLLYWPVIQNLVVDNSESTTKPFILKGNSASVFSLESDTDKLTIDPATGVVSLVDGYTVSGTDTIVPTIKVTSTISGEEVVFGSEDFLKIITSNTALADIPVVDQINLFYPTFEARNSIYGYTYSVINAGSVSEANTWIPQTFNNSYPGAIDERPSDIASSVHSIMTNLTASASLPHESWVFMNSQDISLYQNDFDMEAVFYIQNKYVEYLDDGRTPSNLAVKVATDFTGNENTATWIDVSDVVSCSIQSDPEDMFVGLPYPGDQSGLDPDGKKGHNADAKWVKCVLDLTPYKDASNFTLAFHLQSFFEGEIIYNGTPGGRPGRYYISDVYYVAKVK